MKVSDIYLKNNCNFLLYKSTLNNKTTESLISYSSDNKK